MLASAARQWWVLVLQGVLGIVFGILAIVWPNVTLVTIAYLFAAWAIISGVAQVAEGWRVAEYRGRSWPFAVSGVVSIAAGVLAALYPPAAIGGLILFLGAWLLVSGVMEAYAAYEIRRQIDNEWILAAAGIVRAILGIAILVAPTVGAVLAVATVAWVAIISGIAAIGIGLRLRKLNESVGAVRSGATA